MKGRLENSLLNETRVKNLLDGREDYFREYYYSLSSSKEPTTIYRYVRHAITFVDYLKANKKDFSISDIKKVDIDMYMDSIKYTVKNGELKPTSDRRMANIWSLLHSFIKFLVYSEYIEKDMMEYTERPKIKNRTNRVYMTADEVRTVIHAAETARIEEQKWAGISYGGWETRDLVLLRLLVETGMRVTALVEINVEDIDFENKIIHVVDKRGKEHFHPISEETSTLIEEWLYCKRKLEYQFGLNTADVLFISSKGKQRLTAKSINDIIKKYTKGIDKNITAHKFRSTYATNLYQATGDIYFVKECMGHSNIATTQIYVEPSADSKDKALGIMSKILKE